MTKKESFGDLIGMAFLAKYGLTLFQKAIEWFMKGNHSIKIASFKGDIMVYVDDQKLDWTEVITKLQELAKE